MARLGLGIKSPKRRKAIMKLMDEGVGTRAALRQTAGIVNQPRTSVYDRNLALGPSSTGSPEKPGGPQPIGPPETGGGTQGGSPWAPKAPPAFLPLTPEFVAGQRAAEDALAASQYGIGAQQALIAPGINLQQQRLTTDLGYDKQRLQENVAERGISRSGVYPQLYQRDIGIPYGRRFQDLALGGAGQYGQLSEQLGGAGLGYNQTIAELLLNRAAQVASDMPLSLPQFSSTRRKKKSK